MSVYTEADVSLDLADERIQKAIEALGEIVVNKCWGADDFNEQYKDDIVEAFNLLLQARKKLNRT